MCVKKTEVQEHSVSKNVSISNINLTMFLNSILRGERRGGLLFVSQSGYYLSLCLLVEERGKTAICMNNEHISVYDINLPMI
jgi:hypothetical protein